MKKKVLAHSSSLEDYCFSGIKVKSNPKSYWLCKHCISGVKRIWSNAYVRPCSLSYDEAVKAFNSHKMINLEGCIFSQKDAESDAAFELRLAAEGISIDFIDIWEYEHNEAGHSKGSVILDLHRGSREKPFIIDEWGTLKGYFQRI